MTGMRRPSCERKIRYDSRASAKAHAYGGVRPYPCGFCLGYHNGHKRRKKRTKRKDLAA
jgi:hypothetical protein